MDGMQRYGNAVKLFRQGESEKALEILLTLEKEYESGGLDLESLPFRAATFYAMIGEIYQKSSGAFENKAVEYYEKALNYLERMPRKNDMAIAEILGVLGNLYSMLHNIEKQRECVFREMEIRTDSLERDEYEIALTCYRMGHLAYDEQRYEEARKYYEQGLELKRKSDRLDDKGLADAYTNIGLTYLQCSEFQKAEEYLKEALRLYQKETPEEDTRELAQAFLNLGLLSLEQKQFGAALSDLSNAYRIGKKCMGEDSVFCANAAHNFGVTYRNLRDHQNTEKWLSRAEEKLKKVSPELLFETYYEEGVSLYQQNYFEEALRVFERLKSWNLSELRNVQIGNCIANTLGKLGRDEEAKKQYYEIIKICRDNFPNSFEMANCFVNYGTFLHLRNAYRSALECYQCAYKVYMKRMPDAASKIRGVLYNILTLKFAMMETEMEPYLGQLIHLIRDSFWEGVHIAQEEARIQYFLTLREQLSLCLSILLARGGDADLEQVYELSLSTKNLNDEVILSREIFLLCKKHPEYKEKAARLSACHEKYSTWFYGDQKSDISEVVSEIEELELSFEAGAEGTLKWKTLKNVTANQIAEQLKEGEALLDFFCLEQKFPGRDYQRKKQEIYGMFLIKDGTVYAGKTVSRVKIDSEIAQLRDIIRKGKGGEPYLELLYTYLLSPFGELLKDVSTLYISPECDLFLLPFELLCQNERWISFPEECQLIYLSSPRALIEGEKSIFRKYDSAVVVADPCFYLPKRDDRKEKTERNGKKPVFNQMPDIPYTAVEAALVSDSLSKVWLYTGEKANVSVISEPHEADILHISTHGFFQIRESERENPLLNCGLLFSGVKNDNQETVGQDRYGNGILTGYDIMTKDLSRYRLLVLSACNTGMGAAIPGNGIGGLRRAFELAGIPAIICTLWEEDDFSGALFMGHFYEELSQEEKTVSDALANTKQWMKNLTRGELRADRMTHLIYESPEFTLYRYSLEQFLAGDEKEKPFSAPCHWAGFILQAKGRI